MRQKKKHQKKIIKKKQKQYQTNSFLSAFIFTFLLFLGSLLFRIDPFLTPIQRIESLKELSLKLSVTPTTPIKKPEEKSVFGVAKVQAAAESVSDFCITAPILFYHHVQPLSEAATLGHAQLTVDNQVFAQQLTYLAEHDYTIVSLEEIVDALIKKQTPVKKIAALTFDDGYVDMHTYVLPELRKRGITGSFMIPPGLIGNFDYMSWDQVKDLASDMSVYNHSWSHSYLPGDSTEKQEFEIVHAKEVLQDVLQKDTHIFTYPYGAFNDDVIRLVQKHGYYAGLSTLSGTQQCVSFLMTLHRTRIGNAPLSSYGL